MFFSLKPLEWLWLTVALVITAQQMVVLKGHFDPVALAAIAFFIGMIPAGRADRKGNSDDPKDEDQQDPPSVRAQQLLKELLDRQEKDEKR